MINKLGRSWERGAGAGTLQSQPVWNKGVSWAQDVSVLHWSGLCVVGKMYPKGQELIWGIGLLNLMELRFADDILLFANSGPEAAQLLDKLIVAVGRAGLILNAAKSVVLTNQAQPPPTLVIREDVVVKVLDRNRGQKWLGCMLTAAGSMRRGVDLLYQCFHSNRWILQNRKKSVLSRLKYFDSVVSSMVCFVSSHRTIYKDHLLRLDISFRTLCRAIVAPPSDTNWSLEWRDIIHNRNIRVQDFVSATALKPWSRIVCKQHWDLFCYVAHLLCATLAGTSLGTQNVGLESSRRNSASRSAKAHVGSKSHSFLPLQTLGRLAGLRTGRRSMVGAFWFLLQLLHGLRCSDLHIPICKCTFSFGSPPAPKTGPPHVVQALTLTLTSFTEIEILLHKL